MLGVDITLIEPSVYTSFKNDFGQVITVKGQHSKSIITTFLWPDLIDLETNNIWFEQDGVICYIAPTTLERFKIMFI